MNYQQTLDYMFSALPMYHRIGAAAYKADIQPTLDMMAALGNPERRFRSIHVAGTNGKGSVSHMLASVLQEAGYRVGLYTSPHLVDFRERIRIGGEMIPQEEVTAFVERWRPMFERLQLSFFEMTVGLAFDYFARQQVDVAVVEVGMGGRLDSTNVITPDLSVITNIGLEHTQFLGDTLAKIAGEKGGIIKPGVPVVIGEKHPETEPVFRALSAERHAPIVFASDEWDVSFNHNQDPAMDQGLAFRLFRRREALGEYTCQLTGFYQRHNLITLFGALGQLRQMPFYARIADSHVGRGLAHVVDNTHLHGRWEVIGRSPLTIVETAHNPDGMVTLAERLSYCDHSRTLHLVYGCVSDKDYARILTFLADNIASWQWHTEWYFTQPSVPRRLPVDQLAATAREHGIDGTDYPDVHAAIAAARKKAGPGDLVLVTGSIFLVADALS